MHTADAKTPSQSALCSRNRSLQRYSIDAETAKLRQSRSTEQSFRKYAANTRRMKNRLYVEYGTT